MCAYGFIWKKIENRIKMYYHKNNFLLILNKFSALAVSGVFHVNEFNNNDKKTLYGIQKHKIWKYFYKCMALNITNRGTIKNNQTTSVKWNA